MWSIGQYLFGTATPQARLARGVIHAALRELSSLNRRSIQKKYLIDLHRDLIQLGIFLFIKAFEWIWPRSHLSCRLCPAATTPTSSWRKFKSKLLVSQLVMG
jgi:hypothetical protein